MTRVEEIGDIAELAGYRAAWQALLAETAGASFFQSLEWLEAYWRHFGAGQRLRTLMVYDGSRVASVVPLVVRREWTKVGWLRVLTYPLHDWGSFFAPIGPDLYGTLAAALEYLHHAQRDWDLLELRWLGGAATDVAETQRAMHRAGFPAYLTVWDRTALVDLSGTWEAYFAARPKTWRGNFRHGEKKLVAAGEVSYVRYRPRGEAHGQSDPRWDLYDACQSIARRSWQGSADNGTTLSHASVRQFLRDAHASAAAAGAVDLNLLLLDGRPLAFAYNYHGHGYVYGLRLGYDAQQFRDGAGTVLLGRCLRDSFARGDRIFDLGVGSLECKRHFQTRLADIFRLSYFRPTALRAQLLRAKRWAESPTALWRSAAVGRVQDGTADAR